MSLIEQRPRRVAGDMLRGATRPFARALPVDRWPGWLGTLHHVNVPRNLEPQEAESTAGGANPRIVFRLLASTLALDGDVAECGVWKAQTLLPIAMFVRRRARGKRVWGFDSFQGLDDTVSRDLGLGGAHDERKRIGGFADTSLEAIQRRVRAFGLSDTVKLVPGYFRDTLPRHADLRFAFVHLDCVLYESYRQCLEFFYPRMAQGGVILLDEYNDPPWPGCRQAVDEFMTGRPEAIQRTSSDRYIKYFIRKA